MAAHPPPGGVFALDLSSVIGWAYAPIEWRRPVWGHWELRPKGVIEGEAQRYHRAGEMAYLAFEKFKPSKVIIESPLTVFAMNNDRAARQQLGLRACVLAECSRCEVPWEEYSTDLIRGAVLGTSRFRKGEVKSRVIAWAKANGLDVWDDNETDALCLWTFYAGQMRQGFNIPRHLLIEHDEDTDAETN
jgi:Holliday junction resolvasome RuvABC endonuclease subunit